MVRNAVHNAFLNTLTMGTAFPRVPSRNDPSSLTVTATTVGGSNIIRVLREENVHGVTPSQ